MSAQAERRGELVAIVEPNVGSEYEAPSTTDRRLSVGISAARRGADCDTAAAGRRRPGAAAVTAKPAQTGRNPGEVRLTPRSPVRSDDPINGTHVGPRT
jgi:hypothetical protein